MPILRSLKEDLATARAHDPAARSDVEVFLAYSGLHAIWTYRLTHRLWVAGWRFPARLVSQFARFLTGIEIHPGATIGEGMFIDHGMGVVIGETAVIGDDCSLTQGVTLGGTSTQHEKRHPTLGKNVTVGAGAKLIGAITVGDYARIGAGSVVVTNVPAYATVVGVPGKVVAYYDAGNETRVRLPDPEWDRIEELAQRLDELRSQVSALEAELQEHRAHVGAQGATTP